MIKVYFSQIMGIKKFKYLMVKDFWDLREGKRGLWYQIFYYHNQGLTSSLYQLFNKMT